MMYNDDETEYKVGDQILVVSIFPPMCEVGSLIWFKYIIPIQYFQRGMEGNQGHETKTTLEITTPPRRLQRPIPADKQLKEMTFT